LGNTNALKFDTSISLNVLNKVLSFCRVESDADTTCTSTGRSTRAMNVGFDLLWWLNLNDKVHIWDVEAARCHISSDKHLKLAFFKALHGNFTLVLSNVTMHDLDVLLNFISQDQSISVCLCLSKDNSLALATVANKHISKG
jgi:hypothetical protein